MDSFAGLLNFLDTSSFGSLWYWIALALVWSLMTRGVLGVPPDVIQRARRDTAWGQVGEADAAPEASPDALALLDWLSLTLPRRRISQTEGAILLGLACFGLTVLALLGFTYGFELAQAAVLLLLPLGLLAVLRLRLARRIELLLDRARRGEVPAVIAADRAARTMTTHRWIATALSILAVGVTAAWGTLWRLMHPNGF